MVNFGEFLKAITRQVNFNMTKIGEKSQNSKIQMRYFWVIFKHSDMWKNVWGLFEQFLYTVFVQKNVIHIIIQLIQKAELTLN